MARPNFFIVGAPKCGTTSMFSYLSGHPEVFTPKIKEPHFFATDMPIRQQVKEEDEYLRLFEPSPPTAKAIGEASTWYLYSQDALKNIKAFAPGARILVFLRNPVDVVQSLHWQFCYDAGKRPNFVSAWKTPRSRESLTRFASLGQQLHRAKEIFPAHQMHLVFQEDLKEDPAREYKRILAFLGLSPVDRDDFTVRNANKTHQSLALARFLKFTPEPVDRAWRHIKSAMKIEKVGLGEWLSNRNLKVTRRQSLDPGVRAAVHDAFKDDIRVLEEQSGRDLSHWT